MANAQVHDKLNTLFAQIWSDYTSFNPHAKKIYDELLERERTKNPSLKGLVNDHIALRTVDTGAVNLTGMAKIFEKYGYRACGEYKFEEKKLFARHYEHEDPSQPKVFISELLTSHFSPKVKAMAETIDKAYTASDAANDSLLWSGRKWKASHATYTELLKESEYAAWLYAFGFRCNHFTISFNDLKTFKDLQELNDFVTSKGHKLNTAGGVIKGTPDQLLEQSSTVAGRVKLDFEDGGHEIPACYYEFARRYPKKDGKLYTGFIASSADKIFESTNVHR